MSLGPSLLGAKAPSDAGSCSSMTLESVISQVGARRCPCCCVICLEALRKPPGCAAACVHTLSIWQHAGGLFKPEVVVGCHCHCHCHCH